MAKYLTRRGTTGKRLTHTLHVGLGLTLCGMLEHRLAKDNSDEHSEPTCRTCRARDPRRSRGKNDGPFILKSLLQF